MKIQELEQIVGCDRATIRFYEREGLLVPKRLENGYRDYTTENAQELKKIRLLRQLGVSIEKIRSLQQGSADFSAVLAEQISTLTSQIAEQKRARSLCKVLQEDGARYDTLDASRYLKLLQETSIDEPEPVTQEFVEQIPREIHPWRRFWARILDYSLLNAAVQFVIVVILRIRPVPGEFLNALIGVASAAAFIPLEAWMLSKFRTTPGKYIFGIQVESIQGGNMRFFEAFQRSRIVFVEGMFLNIPFLRAYTWIRRYCELTGRSYHRFVRYDALGRPVEMPWDSECELTYSQWNGRRGVALVCTIAVILALSLTTGADSIRPQYRGSELTIAQFAENYNDCLEILQEDVEIYDKLKPDGTKYPVPQGKAVVDLSSENPTEPELEPYTYLTENGILKSVTFCRHYEEPFFVSPHYEALKLILPILLAQDHCGIQELNAFTEEYESRQEQPEANWIFQDILKIEWQIESENCVQNQGRFFVDKDDEKATLDYTFTITILN